MTAIWALCAQIIMISIAYPTACLAGATVATLVIFGVDPATLPDSGWPEIIRLSIAAVSMAFEAIITAFWPAMIAATVTEGFKLRALIVYLIGGGIVGLMRAIPLSTVMTDNAPPMDTMAVQLSVAAGAIGGLVYWAIAGRTAGHWMELPWFEEQRWR